MSCFNFEEPLGVDLEALQIFLLPHYLGFSGTPIFDDLGFDLEPLCAGVLDVLILPFLDDSEPEPEIDSPTVGSLSFMSLRNELPIDHILRLKEIEVDFHVKELIITNDLTYSTRELLAIRALFIMATLFSFGAREKVWKDYKTKIFFLFRKRATLF
jgi:hypothetical protein